MRTATFDIETNGLLPDVDTIFCAVVKDHNNGQIRCFSPGDIHDLPDYLSQYHILVGHNSIGFDFPVLRKVLGYEYHGIKQDTLLMSRLQRPNRRNRPLDKGNAPHSVRAWGIRFGTSKLDQDDWTQYSPSMLRRCEKDVHIQYNIYLALLEEGKGEGWEEAHKLNHKLFHYLQMQEEYGFLVDQEKMDEALQMLARWMAKIDESILPRLPLVWEPKEIKKDGKYGWVKRPFLKDGSYSLSVRNWMGMDTSSIVASFSRVNCRSVDLDKNLEVKNFLLKLGWKPNRWNTNNKGERTSPKLDKDESFHGIQGGLGKLVVKRFQCRQRRGLIQGWKESIRPDGRIGARVTGLAATGRARHKGIVNVPGSKSFFGKTMRSLFISKPGWVLVGTDSVGNQIRQLAARMGDNAFTTSVLDRETDVHIGNQRRANLKTKDQAKTFFYGIIFGAGDTKTGRIIGGTATDGRRLKEQFFASMPAMKECIDRLVGEWRKTAKKCYNKKFQRMEWRDGYIRGLDGRPIQVDSEHKVLVYQLQSDEAIQMSGAYCIFHKWLDREGYIFGTDYGTVLWMHDEWQIETRPEIADRVAELGNEAIAWAGRYFRISIPHEGSSKIGRSWRETH